MEPEGYRVDAGLHKSDPACESERPCHYIGYGEAYGQVEAQVGESLGKVAGHGQFLSQCGIEEARRRRPMIASDFIDRLLHISNKRRPANDGAAREEAMEKTMVEAMEEGGVMKRFLTALQAGAVLIAAVWAGAGSASTSGQDAAAMSPDMTGAYFMRESLVPRADDLALIRRKPALYLASFNDDMATVAYSVDDGRIVYRVISGTVNDTARDAIDRALVRLQRKLA